MLYLGFRMKSWRLFKEIKHKSSCPDRWIDIHTWFCQKVVRAGLCINVQTSGLPWSCLHWSVRWCPDMKMSRLLCVLIRVMVSGHEDFQGVLCASLWAMVFGQDGFQGVSCASLCAAVQTWYYDYQWNPNHVRKGYFGVRALPLKFRIIFGIQVWFW